jgi:hypothetical protein
MKESLKNTQNEIKRGIKENPNVALTTILGIIAVTSAFIYRGYENKRVEQAYTQRDNPALVVDMCGEDLSNCTVDPITICTDFIYARDMSYCAESETLPLYAPIKSK